MSTATGPVDRGSARHYRWGGVCDGWHLLERGDLSVIEERVPAGASEEPHRHARARQFFYILDGDAVMEVDGRRVALASGQGLEIPPGTAHRFRNDSPRDVRFLVISMPTTRGDREPAAAGAAGG